MAITVLPSANVAEFVLTATGHMIASLVLLHPKFARGTLFEFGLFGEMYEFPIALV
jgi:hypothetical protein